MLQKTKPYKAVAAFVFTLLGLIVQALGDRGADVITAREWFIIIAGSIVTTGVVYRITNPPVDPARDRGAASPLAALYAVVATAAVIVVALLSSSAAGYSFPLPQGPYDADPILKVGVMDPGTGGVRPISASATNTRTLGDNTPIVITSATPAVCAFNSSTGKVTMLKVGTCTIQADQAAGLYYIAGHTERSYTVTRL